MTVPKVRIVLSRRSDGTFRAHVHQEGFRGSDLLRRYSLSDVDHARMRARAELDRRLGGSFYGELEFVL